MNKIIYKDESYNIIGACMEVHSELGAGFLEPVYQEALAVEFNERGTPFEKEKHLSVKYKGVAIDKYYVADFTCYNKILLELKALDSLSEDHIAQVMNYLKITEMKLGMLINFGSKKLQYKRVVC